MQQLLEMSVNKSSIIFLLILLLFFCTNCNVKKSDNNEYEIVSLLIKEFVEPLNPSPPPYPDTFVVDSITFEYRIVGKWKSKEDSIKYYNDYATVLKKIKDDRKNKKFLIAIDSNFTSFESKVKLINCSEYLDLIEKSKTSNRPNINVDIEKISKKKNDSLLYFKDELLESNSKDFYKFDVRISFSEIIFNENYSRATVIFSISRSRLAGATVLYFLEKINDEWQITCEEGLSIS